MRRYLHLTAWKSTGYSEKYNSFSYPICPTTGTKLREPYHLYHVILPLGKVQLTETITTEESVQLNSFVMINHCLSPPPPLAPT